MALTTLTYLSNTYAAYLTVAEADRLLSVEPHRAPAWLAASDVDKTLYLITATRRLDTLAWNGLPVVAAQSTAWPRTGVGVAANAIPAAIERAAALIAGGLALQPDLWSETDYPEPELASERVGPISRRVFRRRASPLENIVPDLIARRLIGPFLLGDPLGIGQPV